MAKVIKVIAAVKGRQEIDKLVIMNGKAEGYFCGPFSAWENTPEVLADVMECIKNMEVVAHSVGCGNTLLMIVDDTDVQLENLVEL